MTVYIPIFYQVFYVVIPTISLVGNCSVVYVTIRSRTLRSACNIFIALISLGDAVHMLAHFAMIALYHISPVLFTFSHKFPSFLAPLRLSGNGEQKINQ
ncbi:hypothetical protein OESDEN_22502 [Oesophagostomum dentatum]|uniref:G-protein coupled receptors family 1 profile domain-containing protein n=1 Tax=Oesophagostomum dentatum TaxID=61180 RepID=A0A0B1RXT1_OESDE|nr:hypothetical protein OESDEN_22502 [Oesophagostomum dentatum]